MNEPRKRIQILYEISLSIGTRTSLEETAETALSAYIKKLNCTAGAVIERQSEDDQAVRYQPVAMMPSPETVTGFPAALDAVPTETSDDQSFQQSLPITENPTDGVTYYIMELPEFGVLVLVFTGRELDSDTVSALRPLNQKLATACANERYETKLRAERDRFEAVFTTINEPLVTVRPVDDTLVVTRCNPAFRELFGNERRETVGEPLSSLLGDPPTADDALPAIGGTETTAPVMKEIQREKTDKMGTFLLRSAPIKRDSEHPEHLVLLIDLTEEAALKRREEKLERQNEQLEKFASMVSHDLRNPLGIAETYVDFAEQTGNSEDFDAIREALDRMDTMIDDLLTMARTGTEIEDTETFSFYAAVREGWEYIEAEDAELNLNIPDGYLITANRELMLNIFENLFRNAVEHGGEDVSIFIGMIEKLSTTTRVSPTDQYAGFYVEDDGPGIEAKNQDDVFEMGHSTNGTGLGLSIVADIVEGHDWSICATDSTVGGARFEITGMSSDIYSH